MEALEAKRMRSVIAWRLSLVFVVVCVGVPAAAQSTNSNDGKGLTVPLLLRFVFGHTFKGP